MARRALQAVKDRYSWEHVAQQTLAVYRRVLQAAKQDPEEPRDTKTPLASLRRA